MAVRCAEEDDAHGIQGAALRGGPRAAGQILELSGVEEHAQPFASRLSVSVVIRIP